MDLLLKYEGRFSRRRYCVGYYASNLGEDLTSADLHRGVAYTIDPVYESEVRDYLGKTAFAVLSVAQFELWYSSSDYREKARWILVISFEGNNNINRMGIPWKHSIYTAQRKAMKRF
jgi:hypothetical protein